MRTRPLMSLRLITTPTQHVGPGPYGTRVTFPITGGSFEGALATYERLRRTRVERVVAYSARVSQSKTPGTVGRWLRDLVMPFALEVFASPDAQAWLYAYHIDWSERVA